ncbi:MAG: hypothetical protein Ct9H300mP14_10730 [Gammaproteobacteria bacterium]|nr:MAG: hypothetical protein Ct9H300mP14_10730 [Gammaproteobacteria bacterium]
MTVAGAVTWKPAWRNCMRLKQPSVTVLTRCVFMEPMGIRVSSILKRYYRDAPLLAIGEGTNELQRIIIPKSNWYPQKLRYDR